MTYDLSLRPTADVTHFSASLALAELGSQRLRLSNGCLVLTPGLVPVSSQTVQMRSCEHCTHVVSGTVRAYVCREDSLELASSWALRSYNVQYMDGSTI